MKTENVSNKILAHYSNVIICFDVKLKMFLIKSWLTLVMSLFVLM